MCPRWIISTAVLMGPIAFFGCSSGPVQPMDTKSAVAAVETALTTWQRGEAIDALPKRSPPIYFNDQRPARGLQLSGFKIADRTEIHGPGVRVFATLNLKTPEGTREAKVRYLVDSGKAVVITPD